MQNYAHAAQDESRLPSIRVAFVTLGCAKNEVDSASMARTLLQHGISVVDDAEQADCVIVNTCSFIQAATEESLAAIFDLADTEGVRSGRTKMVVAGCMPARYGEELEAELSEACAFLPCAQEQNVVEVVRSLFPEAGSGDIVDQMHSPVSTYVKISDGCDRFCSFCTIPFIRGRYHSFTYDQIEGDVMRAVDAGAREIVLIAQDTGRWGNDFEEESSLAQLVEQLATRFAHTWFRVMYIQPEGVTDELLDVIAAHDNVCSYLDIPFQHCCERILKRMNRRGSYDEYLALVNHIRDKIEAVTIRTTLMAGFPGETDEEFDELLSFVEEADLDYVGVFAYSQEDNTRAGSFDDQIDEDTKIERAQQVRDVADSLSHARVARRVGMTLDVLVLGCEEDGQLYGRAQCQAPDVDGVTYVSEGEAGDVVRVRIADTLLYEMEGE